MRAESDHGFIIARNVAVAADAHETEALQASQLRQQHGDPAHARAGARDVAVVTALAVAQQLLVLLLVLGAENVPPCAWGDVPGHDSGWWTLTTKRRRVGST